jgi:hypothetical protein
MFKRLRLQKYPDITAGRIREVKILPGQLIYILLLKKNIYLWYIRLHSVFIKAFLLLFWFLQKLF